MTKIKTKIGIIISFIALIILFTSINYAQMGIPGIPIWYEEVPWYQVEDWEVDVCSKWGGTEFAGQAATTSGRKVPFATMSATVQGKKFKTLEGNFVYEAAWYIESYAEVTNYEITFINSKEPQARHQIDAGALSPESGAQGYDTYDLTEDYTHIKLQYTGGHVQVPIIQVR